MKKALAAFALAGSVALIGAGPAMADLGYSPTAPAATVSDAAVAPGEQFIFSGSGMLPNEPVSITVTAVDGAAPAAGAQSVASKINVFLAPETFSTTANANGEFSLAIDISTGGTFSILATGAISGTTVGPVTVKVDPAFAAGGSGASLANSGGAPLANTGSGLANTGADSGLVLWTIVGAGALAAGAASVVVVRRRAKTEAAA